jgi:hypothetical protein
LLQCAAAEAVKFKFTLGLNLFPACPGLAFATFQEKMAVQEQIFPFCFLLLFQLSFGSFKFQQENLQIVEAFFSRGETLLTATDSFAAKMAKNNGR